MRLSLIIILFCFLARSDGLHLSPAVKLGGYVAHKYMESLNSQPFVTNIITASALSVLSDAISQRVETSGRNTASSNAKGISIESPSPEVKGLPIPIKDRSHSFYRSFCMSIYGAVIFGWLVTYWFKFLNSLVPPETITLPRALLKVSINQVVMSPLLNSLFFGYVILVRDLSSTLREKLTLYKKKVAVDLLPTIMRSCAYWGCVQFFNFAYLPIKFQLLYTNLAFVVWTAYVSFIGYKRIE